MDKIRRAAVAGMFYPAEEEELRRTVANFLDAAPLTQSNVKAIIVPHAGYPYSGPVAGSAYRQLSNQAGAIRRVVLLGPAHRVRVRGLAASSAASFVTPLGKIPLDHDALRDVLALPQVQLLDAAHAAEHSLEVQLPFLQCVIPAFRIVPLVVGQATPDEVAEVLERLWGGPETLIVISSDLSHFRDYATAKALDKATARAIERLEFERLDEESACGRIPIAGLLQAARHRGLQARLVDLRSSGDTAGSRDRVVGYGAFVFC